jgi:hypothetical protein
MQTERGERISAEPERVHVQMVSLRTRQNKHLPARHDFFHEHQQLQKALLMNSPPTPIPALLDTYAFTAKIIREHSSSSCAPDELGEHLSTMALFCHKLNERYSIEWDIPAAEETTAIGIWTEHVKGKLTLTDYDGVFNLPKQAVKLLRRNGIRVPKD